MTDGLSLVRRVRAIIRGGVKKMDIRSGNVLSVFHSTNELVDAQIKAYHAHRHHEPSFDEALMERISKENT